MTCAAFNAYLMGAGKENEDFQTFCQRWGLIKRRILSDEERKALAVERITKAERIKKLDEMTRNARRNI